MAIVKREMSRVHWASLACRAAASSPALLPASATASAWAFASCSCPFQLLELFPEGLELLPGLEDGGGPGFFRRFAARQLVPQPLLFQKGVGPLVFMDGDLRFPGGNPVLEVFPDLGGTPRFW